MISVFTNSWALLFGMMLLMVGNGLHGTLLGVRGEIEQFSTFQMSQSHFDLQTQKIARSNWGQIKQATNGTQLGAVHVVKSDVIFKQFGKFHDPVVVKNTRALLHFVVETNKVGCRSR